MTHVSPWIRIPTHPIFAAGWCAVAAAWALCYNSAPALMTAACMSVLALVVFAHSRMQRIICLSIGLLVAVHAYYIHHSVSASWSDLDGSRVRYVATVIDVSPYEAGCLTLVPSELYHMQKLVTLPRSASHLRIYTKHSSCTIGQTITGYGTMHAPPDESRALYALRSGLWGSIYGTRITCTTDALTVPWYRALRIFVTRIRDRMYHRISERIQPLVSPHTFQIFQALVLGATPSDARPEWDSMGFGQWGIIHILARSGLHVTLLLCMLGWLIGMIPLTRAWRSLIVSIILGGYTIITWSNISFIRAVMMAAAYQYATARTRRISTWYTLHIVLIGMLLYNPYLITGLDVQLSFGCTYILLWLSQIDRQERILRV